jgi:hypothetical protein
MSINLKKPVLLLRLEPSFHLLFMVSKLSHIGIYGEQVSPLPALGFSLCFFINSFLFIAEQAVYFPIQRL